MTLALIVGIVRNVSLNRWHPVYFEPYPLEDDPQIENVSRYRSKGLSTEGCPSREECIKEARELALWISKRTDHPVLLSLERDITWEGQNFPSLDIYFLIKATRAIPVYRE